MANLLVRLGLYLAREEVKGLYETIAEQEGRFARLSDDYRAEVKRADHAEGDLATLRASYEDTLRFWNGELRQWFVKLSNIRARGAELALLQELGRHVTLRSEWLETKVGGWRGGEPEDVPVFAVTTWRDR